MDKVEVEFDRPRHGWISMRVRAGVEGLEINASAVPRDSIGDLVSGLALMLKGGSDAEVTWHEEPAEYHFHFADDADGMRLRVTYAQDRSRAGAADVFGATGSRVAVCLPFWRALRRLESMAPPEDYRRLGDIPFRRRSCGRCRLWCEGIESLRDKSLLARGEVAVGRVVVDQSGGLHEGVDDGGADEGHAALLEVFRE